MSRTPRQRLFSWFVYHFVYIIIIGAPALRVQLPFYWKVTRMQACSYTGESPRSLEFVGPIGKGPSETI